MTSRVRETVFGCRDHEALALFWCELLDFIVLDRDEDSIEIGPREGFDEPRQTFILTRNDEPENA